MKKENARKNSKIFLVYSCSGCSSSAQMANWLAVQLDRAGLAEMSCIAGIGGNISSIVNKALTAKTIGIDGCALGCVRSCLKQIGLSDMIYYELSEFGVKKKYHEDFDHLQAIEIFQQIKQKIQNCQK